MVALLLAWAWVVEIVHAFCPPRCICDDKTPRAQCVGVGINMVPILFNPNLRRLNMAHNIITSVGGALVFLDKLEDLDFSYNLITLLGKGDFKSQIRLKELRLAHNNLTTVSLGAFQGLTSLAILDLSHNSLAEISVGILDDVPQLTVLHLQHNRLHVIMPRTFRRQSLLQVLDLCDNFFRHVPSGAMEDLVNLKILLLCRNRLSKIESIAFPTDDLSHLSLETNGIDSIHEMAFLRLQQLRELNLDGNVLQDIPTDALAPLMMLNILSLNRNRLRLIGKESFRGLGELRILHLSRCPHLQVVHPNALSGCHKLQNLTISNSPLLQSLPLGLLTSLHQLQSLDLRANGLQGLAESEVRWSSMRNLDLRDNPVVCNCSIRWLAEILHSPNASVKVADLQCASPEKLQGLYLSRLVPNEHLCGESAEVVVGVVLVSISFVLILTLLLLLCRYLRQQQRFKCSSEWPGSPAIPTWQQHGSCHHERARTVVVEDLLHHSRSTITKSPVTRV